MLVFVGADARGVGTYPLPIPANALYAGMQLFGQFAWLDACGAQGLSASPGLQLTTRSQ